jgi:hypothetical protein
MDNSINELNERLIRQLLDDLTDSSKCTPGLYTVIRGIINDNRESLNSIPTDNLDSLESKVPFKFKSAIL